MQTNYSLFIVSRLQLVHPATMVSNCVIAIYATIVLIVLCLLKAYLRSGKVMSLPPGPKGLPLVGNLCDMPVEKEWLTFARWGEKYGAFYLVECPSLRNTQSAS